MILLILFSFLITIEHDLVRIIFVNSIPTLDALTTWFTNVSIPTSIYNILSNVAYFLPMTTINILFGFTATIIFFKIVISIIHFLTLGKVE